MTDVNAIVQAAIQAAANLNPGAQNAAGAMASGAPGLPATQTQNTAVVAANSNAPSLQLEDMITGMTVDAFIKLKHEGIFLKDDPTPFQEIRVRIRGSEIAPHKAVRFGNPAVYKKSYNGQVEYRTGKPWVEVVAASMAADPRCTGDYDSFDLPFHVVNDLVSMMPGNKLLIPAGAIIGYSTAVTAGKDVKAFVKNVVMKYGKEELLEGVIRLKKLSNEKGKWGVLEFGDASNWTVVQEAPPEAEAA